MKKLKLAVVSSIDGLKNLVEFNGRCNGGFGSRRACLHHSLSLTKEERERIHAFWAPYRKGLKCRYAFDEKRYGLYKKTNEQFGLPLEYYIPDSYYYSIIDRALTRPSVSNAMDDKNLYDLYFHDVKRPVTVARVVDGVFMDVAYKPITKQELVALCKSVPGVICKPSIAACGGKGISFWSVDEGEAKLDEILSQPHLIIQGLQTQHETMRQLYADSLNTVRVLTLMQDNECHILSSVVRTGVDGNKVDNVSSGGYACGIIPETGRLRRFAYNNKGDAIEVHPQGAVYADFTIPSFDRIKALAIDCAYRFSGVSKLVSWDFAISPEGDPVLIEGNLTWGELDFHQMCNGPVFGNDTPQLMEWFSRKYLK